MVVDKMILIDATIRYKGYNPNDLKFKSGKRICVSCDKCGRVRYVPIYAYRDLCRSCSLSGKNNPMYGVHRYGKDAFHYGHKHTEETKRKIGNAHKGMKHTDESKKLMRNNSLHISGKDHPMYGKIGKLNPNYGRHHSDETKRKISESKIGKMLGEANSMYGKDFSGYNNPNWKGGYEQDRSHLLNKKYCIKLNTKINEFEFHHISKSVGIFLPHKLHRSIKHSLKTGLNMYEINKISLNYLMGDF